MKTDLKEIIVSSILSFIMVFLVRITNNTTEGLLVGFFVILYNFLFLIGAEICKILSILKREDEVYQILELLRKAKENKNL